MPVMRCMKDSRPGWKWGENGTCYTYDAGNDDASDRAERQAERQGRAVESSKHRDERSEKWER